MASWRSRACPSAVVLVAILGGTSCSDSHAQSAPSPTTTIMPTTAAIVPKPASPTAAPCSADQLSGRGGRQGENGGAHGDIELTNSAATPCLLDGLATVMLVAAGRPLGIEQHLPADATISRVTVEPGSVSHTDLTLYWSNWCSTDPGPLTASITLPHAGGTLSIPFNGPPDYNYLPRCDDASQPSTIQVLGYTQI